MILWALLTLIVAIVVVGITSDHGRGGALDRSEMLPLGTGFVALLFGAIATAPLALALHVAMACRR